MANFVEQATLLVNDKSTAQIRKINAELKSLLKTAKQLANLKIRLQGLSQLSGQLRAATTAINNLNRQTNQLRRPINARVNLQGAQAVTQQINRLTRPRNLNINAGMGGGGFGGGGGGGGAGRPVVGGLAGFSQALLRTTRQLLLFQIATNTVMAGLSEAGQGIIDAEDARTRIRQAGFTGFQALGFEDTTRDIQKEFGQIPAANVLDASVELLSTLKATGASAETMKSAMARVAENAQVMGVTFKDAAQGAESARMLEKIANIFNLGTGVGDQPKIRALQSEIERAVVAAGGDLTVEEAVRTARQLGSSVTLGLSAEAFAKILSVRDEGGARSTAEVRTAIRDLTRTSLEKKLKQQQAAVGLRETDARGNLVLKGDLSRQLAKDPTQFAFDVLKPIVVDLGGELDTVTGNLKDVSEVARILTTQMGFSTTGAQFFADALTSQAQVVKDAVARGNVDLNAQLNDNTIRGAFNRLVAAFDTASAVITNAVNGPLAGALNSVAAFITEFSEIFKTEHVTPEDIAARRLLPFKPLEPGVPRDLRSAIATPEAKSQGLRDLQKVIGAKVDAVLGPETAYKFFQAWGKLTNEVPAKINSVTQYMKDAWTAAGENLKAESVTFKHKLGLAVDFLVEKLLQMLDLGAGGSAEENNARLRAFIGQQVADFADLILRNLGKAVMRSFAGFDVKMDFANSPVGKFIHGLFYKTVQTPGGPQEVSIPLSDYLPDAVNKAVASIQEFAAWIGSLSAKTANDAYLKLLEGIGWVTTGFQMIKDALNDAIGSIKSFAAWLASFNPFGETPYDPTKFKPGLGGSADDAREAGIRRWQMEDVLKRGPGGGFEENAPEIVSRQLSALAEQAIDGISQGADKLAAAGQTFPARGTEFGNNANTAINAASLGAQFGNAAAAIIGNIVANVSLSVAGGGKPDTGQVGTPALA